jgi:hypothetical protein
MSVVTPDQVADRLAIVECLNRSAMAADLMEAEGWKATYWPDAYEDHGWFKGNAHQFVDETIPSLAETMDMTWHFLGNTTMAFEAEGVRVVTYFYAYCRLIGPDAARSDSFYGGRYVDWFEKRNGAWKIKRRVVKGDWIRDTTGSFPWGREVQPGYAPTLGMRDPDDPGRFLFDRSRSSGS